MWNKEMKVVPPSSKTGMDALHRNAHNKSKVSHATDSSAEVI